MFIIQRWPECWSYATINMALRIIFVPLYNDTRLCMFIVYMLSISRRRFYKFSIKCHHYTMSCYESVQSHSAAYYSKVIVVSTLNFAATQHAVNMK